MSKENPVVLDTSKLKAEVVGNIVNVTYDDDKAFLGTTDIPVETFKKVSKHQSNYADAAVELASKFALEQMEKDKSIEKASFSFPYSTSDNGELNVNVFRSKTYPESKFSTNGPVTKSAIRVTIDDPTSKPTAANIKRLEADLTKALLG